MAEASEKEKYPVEVSNIQKMEMVEVVNNHIKLICSKDSVPGTTNIDYPLYYASIYDLLNPKSEMDQHQQYVVLRRKPLQDAYDTFNFLSTCDHPSILKPYGFWENDDGLGFIAFPLIDGTLRNLPSSELFSMQLDAKKESCLKGFSPNGVKAFRDIVSSVHYVNEQYPQASASSSGSTGSTLQMLPLKVGSNRIFYRKIPSEEYEVFLGDISTRNHWPSKMKNNPSVEDIKRSNWNGLGDCLTTLMKGHNSNDELSHLEKVLKERTVRFDDILCEPALWDSKIRIRFIREIVWCLENDKTGGRQSTLSKLPSLGLKDCIKELGVEYNEDKSLLSSVMFLRHKIVAHQDDPYRNYSGPKEQVGLAKAPLEKLVLNSKPDYMLKLIEAIRKLKWIRESPLVRSITSYMEPFNTNQKIGT